MRPLHFGTAERRIYGVYHPSTAGGPRRGAVLCQPVGKEYYRSHRACRSLARSLAARGVHVLRFDYLGTGDSHGEAWDYTAADWVENVGQAVDELRDMAGLRTVHLVGLRFGAALCSAAAETRNDVEGVVLWDAFNDAEESEASLVDDAYATEFVDELRRLAARNDYLAGKRTLVASTVSAPEPATALRQSLEASGAVCDLWHGPCPSVWAKGADFGSVGMPAEAMKAIAAWILRQA